MGDITIHQAFDLALRHHQAGRLPHAEQIYRQILAQMPEHAAAMHHLGLIAHQVGRNDIAIELIRGAIALGPSEAEPHYNLGIALQQAGEIDQAIACYRQAITLRPDYADAHNNLGNALKGKGELDAAIAAYRQAIVRQPTYAPAHNNLGNALREQGMLDEAIAACRRAIALDPNFADALNNLGNALRDKGQLDDAIAAYRKAAVLNPNLPEAHGNLGNALRDKGQLDEAVAAYRRAIDLRPGYAEAHSNLGNALKDKGLFDEAMAAHRHAVDLNPSLAEAYHNLGVGLGDNGQIDEAITAYRQAIALRPGHAEAHGNLLLTLHYHAALDARAIAEEHRGWERRHAGPLRALIQPHANTRDPDRPLRIGYVSPDFRKHAVAPLLLPLLANHDRRMFRVFCFAQVPRPDAMTERFRAQAEAWRSTVGLSDEQVAALVRQDQIDILVDLAGHTRGGRLLVFARKPAPVQITWLGYPDTTGLATIDYRLTDAHADPPGCSETLHSEQLLRLPRTNWVYQPPENGPEPDHQPPRAGLTFGCFNNLAKITEPMLILWARILEAVPGSSLLLKARGLGAESARKRVRELLTKQGTDPARLELRGSDAGYRAHLAQYNRVDIALDPFPYHGTATTCEALWMGVPVITLAGQTHVSRVGASLLSSMGLCDLIAATPRDYIRIAAELANDLPRLRQLHLTLRQRMERSPLTDAPRFAREIETAYREVWRRWCAATSNPPP